MKTSDGGIKFITQWERFMSTPYPDEGGVPTIGYGTIRYPSGKKVTLSDKAISVEQAMVYFKSDLIQFEHSINILVKSILNQNQFDALASFTYNEGATQLKNSTLLKLINVNANNPKIEDAFKRFIYDDGKISNGLVNRRQDEVNLYFLGV